MLGLGLRILQNNRYVVGGPYNNKDDSHCISGSILGLPYFGKLPCRVFLGRIFLGIRRLRGY